MPNNIDRRLNIAYNDFRQTVNQIVNAELNRCKNRQSDFNNREYIDDLIVQVLDIDAGRNTVTGFPKDLRRVPHAYSNAPQINQFEGILDLDVGKLNEPERNGYSRNFGDSYAGSGSASNIFQDSSHGKRSIQDQITRLGWTPDKSRLEKIAEVSLLDCKELSNYQCRDNPSCKLITTEKGGLDCVSKISQRGQTVNMQETRRLADLEYKFNKLGGIHGASQNKSVKTCKTLCNMFVDNTTPYHKSCKEGELCNNVKCNDSTNKTLKSLTEECKM